MESKVEWMDLKRQFKIHEEEFMSTVLAVCKDSAFSGGKYVQKFEENFTQYCNVKATSGVSSGTAALFLGLKALGIKSGDEVIIPANTFIASAWGASHNGATPVFADIDPNTFEIDVEKIEEKITSKTKAIIGVHLYGQPFNVDTVKAIAEEHNLFLIEDCAQAQGAVYKGKRVGSFGAIGCFSFYPGKNLGSFGEAGAVTSNDDRIIEYVNTLKNHGSTKTYHHDIIGYNMRMDGIQGAILCCKLKYLEIWNKRRQKIASMYQKGIKNKKIKLQKQTDFATSVYHLFVVDVDDRNRFRSYLERNGISSWIHYPIPCHLQKVYAHLGYKRGDLPFAEYHADHCVSIPMYPELTDLEVEKVIEFCNRY